MTSRAGVSAYKLDLGADLIAKPDPPPWRSEPIGNIPPVEAELRYYDMVEEAAIVA